MHIHNAGVSKEDAGKLMDIKVSWHASIAKSSVSMHLYFMKNHKHYPGVVFVSHFLFGFSRSGSSAVC